MSATKEIPTTKAFTFTFLLHETHIDTNELKTSKSVERRVTTGGKVNEVTAG